MGRETRPVLYKLELARAKMQEDRVANYQWEVANIGGRSLRQKPKMRTVVPAFRLSECSPSPYWSGWLFANDKGNQMDET